jgi:hypothetical protein
MSRTMDRQRSAIEVLRAELKAIQEWPVRELRMETETIAVIFRQIRAQELKHKIAEIASMN